MSTIEYILGENVTCDVHYSYDSGSLGPGFTSSPFAERVEIEMVVVRNQTNIDGSPSDPEAACILDNLNEETIQAMEVAAMEGMGE